MQNIVLIIGANKGLGLAIARVAGTRDSSAHYILACRDIDAGAAAIDDLKKNGVCAPLELIQLHTTEDSTIAKAVDHIAAVHGKLDGKQ
jgi:NAD(P)-dependent dehydrogenase (short-subunit alcohol dehydrogenase family)